MSMREQVLSLLDAMIKAQPGSKGNGCDEVAQRNGIVLAYNAVFDMEWPTAGEEPAAFMYQHDETARTAFRLPDDRMNERRWNEIPLFRAPQIDRVAIPADMNQARAMAILGINWLKENAPDQLVAMVAIKQPTIAECADLARGCGVWDVSATDIAKRNSVDLHRYTLEVLNKWATPQPDSGRAKCTWTPMQHAESVGDYDTGCGTAWSFIDGGLLDNGCKFCPVCGGEIIDAALAAKGERPCE